MGEQAAARMQAVFENAFVCLPCDEDMPKEASAGEENTSES